MFDSRKQNPNCNFAEEVVSYIYDEMKSSEKTVFETHLAKCSPCADEISAFSSVSFSIKEWRDEEFATLETPQIEIPYETEEIKTTLVETEVIATSWLDNFRKLFNFSPKLLKTATAFGTLAIAIGLVWFLVGSMSENDNSIATVEKETNEQKNENITPKTTEENTPKEPTIAKDERAFEDSDKQLQPQKVVVINTPKPRNPKKTVKVNNSSKSKMTKKLNKVKNKSKSNRIKKSSKPKQQKPNNNKIQEVPRLIDFAMEETEEKGLRLTDYFEDDESGD